MPKRCGSPAQKKKQQSQTKRKETMSQKKSQWKPTPVGPKPSTSSATVESQTPKNLPGFHAIPPRTTTALERELIEENEVSEKLAMTGLPNFNAVVLKLAEATGRTPEDLVGQGFLDTHMTAHPLMFDSAGRNKILEPVIETQEGEQEEDLHVPLMPGQELQATPVALPDHMHNVFPPPSTVLVDRSEVESLVSSGLMNGLSKFSYSEVKELGPMMLVIGKDLTVLMPYHMVMLKVLCSFYISLNNIGYSYDAITMLHYALKHSRSMDVSSASDETKAKWQDLFNYGLTELVSLAGSVYIGDTYCQSEDPISEFGYNTWTQRIDEMRIKAPMIASVFNLIGHFMVGGVDYIYPVPNIIQYNPNLQKYIDTIASGSNNYFSLHYSVQPRAYSLRQSGYHAYLVGTGKDDQKRDKSTNPDASATQKQTPILKTITELEELKKSVDPNYKQKTKEEGQADESPYYMEHRVDQNWVLMDDEPPKSQNRANSSNETIPIGTNPSGGAKKDHPHSLSGQGKSAGKTIIRNTTAFREGIERKAAESGNMQVFLDAALALFCETQNKMEFICEEISSLKRSIATLDQSFGIMVARDSMANLNVRESINKTLLEGSTRETQTTIIASNSAHGIRADDINEILMRVANFKSGVTDVAGLTRDIKTALTDGGNKAFADGVSEASVNHINGRKKIMIRLKELPQYQSG